jgi:hypothetical protein
MRDCACRRRFQLFLFDITDIAVRCGNLTPVICVSSENHRIPGFYSRENLRLRAATEADRRILNHGLGSDIFPVGSCNNSARIFENFHVDIRVLHDTIRRNINRVIDKNHFLRFVYRPFQRTGRHCEQHLPFILLPEKATVKRTAYRIVIEIDPTVSHKPEGIENLVIDDGRIYEIIKAEKGVRKKPSGIDLLVGPKLWKKKPPLLRHHIEALLFQQRRILSGMEKSERAKGDRRYGVIKRRVKALEERLKW